MEQLSGFKINWSHQKLFYFLMNTMHKICELNELDQLLSAQFIDGMISHISHS